MTWSLLRNRRVWVTTVGLALIGGGAAAAPWWGSGLIASLSGNAALEDASAAPDGVDGSEPGSSQAPGELAAGLVENAAPLPTPPWDTDGPVVSPGTLKADSDEFRPPSPSISFAEAIPPEGERFASRGTLPPLPPLEPPSAGGDTSPRPKPLIRPVSGEEDGSLTLPTQPPGLGAAEMSGEDMAPPPTMSFGGGSLPPRPRSEAIEADDPPGPPAWMTDPPATRSGDGPGLPAARSFEIGDTGEIGTAAHGALDPPAAERGTGDENFAPPTSMAPPRSSEGPIEGDGLTPPPGAPNFGSRPPSEASQPPRFAEADPNPGFPPVAPADPGRGSVPAWNPDASARGLSRDDERLPAAPSSEPPSGPSGERGIPASLETQAFDSSDDARLPRPDHGYGAPNAMSADEAEDVGPVARDPIPRSDRADGPPANPPAHMASLGRGDERIAPPVASGVPVDRGPSVPSGPTGPPTARLANVPGPSEIEGVQAPEIRVIKLAPPEVQLGVPAIWEIAVLNAGSTAVRDVTVYDAPPQGMRFVQSSPSPTDKSPTMLAWSLGVLGPDEERTIRVTLVPEVTGELGSVASVTFAAQASAKTICTQPILHLSASSAGRALIGDTVSLRLVAENRGTGTARSVVLEADLPEGLTHPAGQKLEYPIGDLPAGQVRELDLALAATGAGLLPIRLRLTAEGPVGAEARSEVEILAPKLQVAAQGPKVRFLGRQAQYDLLIANPGTAAAEDVDLIFHLPQGMAFVGANNQGQYDESRHAVYWSLVELPPGESGKVQVTLNPVAAGDQMLRVESAARLNLHAVSEMPVRIEGLAELEFNVRDRADPIEVGAASAYEIVISNRGTAAATDVTLAAALTEGLRPTNAAGPARFSVEGQVVRFEPLPRIEPGATETFRVEFTGVQEGDHRVRVSVHSREMPTPVLKEERTRVYSDR